MRLHVRDVEQLEELIDRFAFFGQTTTSIMQTSPVAAPARAAARALTTPPTMVRWPSMP